MVQVSTLEPTNPSKIHKDPADLNFESNYSSTPSKGSTCHKKLKETKNEETQFVEKDTLNCCTLTLNEFNGLDEERNKYFDYENTSSKRDLASIFKNEKYKPTKSMINNVENSSRTIMESMPIVNYNHQFIQTPLPRWVSEEELFAFERESDCPFIENSKESATADSLLKQDKPEHIYSRKKEDQNSENGVDELMKLYPLSCCDKLVRSQNATNYVQAKKME